MEAQLRNQQKLESIGVLASGVAHEINNPLNGIMNYSQIITDLIHERKENCEDTKAEIDSYAEEIISETKRISTIVKDLLQFSRVEKQQMAKTNIRDIIRSMESLINIIVKRDQIDFTMDISDDLPDINCRSHQIQQVILNLLTNSKDALNIKYPGYDEDKKIILTAGPVQKDGRPYKRITVEDRGNGVPEKIRDKILDPFFTTKSRAEGTGLGLSISYGIIKDHGGELSFESEEGKYTRFFIDLPIGEKS
jgi:signal transduction histidine kinase